MPSLIERFVRMVLKGRDCPKSKLESGAHLSGSQRRLADAWLVVSVNERSEENPRIGLYKGLTTTKDSDHEGLGYPRGGGDLCEGMTVQGARLHEHFGPCRRHPNPVVSSVQAWADNQHRILQ